MYNFLIMEIYKICDYIYIYIDRPIHFLLYHHVSSPVCRLSGLRTVVSGADVNADLNPCVSLGAGPVIVFDVEEEEVYT